eukprot:767267-Hanusia_phi.AAC.1
MSEVDVQPTSPRVKPGNALDGPLVSQLDHHDEGLMDQILDEIENLGGGVLKYPALAGHLSRYGRDGLKPGLKLETGVEGWGTRW